MGTDMVPAILVPGNWYWYAMVPGFGTFLYLRVVTAVILLIKK